MVSGIWYYILALSHGIAALGPDQVDTAASSEVIEALKTHGIDAAKLLRSGDIAPSTKHSDLVACDVLCSALHGLYGSEHLLRRDDVVAYDAFRSSYWSNNQADLRPACVFKPADSASISIGILLSRFNQCPFAVKSGGHASFAGASSSDGGLTISLENMRDITIAQDRKTVAVEPGNTWGALYRELEKQHLTVVGGRVASVGVGGLTTGGGISFFSNLYGWACDNVASFEVVLASGRRLTASPSENADLYFALRGGGANLGIVTKFNYFTYPLPAGELWGGSRSFTEAGFPSAIHAFTTMSQNAKSDLNAGTWLSWIMINGTKLAIAELWYARRDGGNASIFDEYQAIPAITDDTQNRKLSEYAGKVDEGTPKGFREYFYVMTVKSNEEINCIAKDIYFDNLHAIDKIPGAFTAMTFQSITVPQIEQMAKNGGNPLGLRPLDGPLTLILLNPRWISAGDDETMYRFGSNVLKRIKREAATRGFANDYLYMNYAAQYQDVIASYGTENKKKLMDIAGKYDPQRVFQTLSSKYFRLEGAPVPGSDFFDL